LKRIRAVGPELLICLGGLVFAILGRGRWANVEADHGFWFSAAQSMITGGRAMHEVRLQWGPMPLWILEGVGRVFGMRVASFIVFQFFVGVLAVLGVQVFARRFLGPVERWISAAILVALIVWMVGPGSLLYPCAFAMSQGLLLTVIVLFVADGLLRRETPMVAATISGLLAGVTFLTKQEFGVAAALGIASLIAFRPDIMLRRKLASLFVAGGAFVVAYFGILDLARHGQPWREFFASNVLWPWVRLPGPWAALYRKVLGLDDPGARMIEAGNSLVDLFAFGGTAWFALYFVDLRRNARAWLAGGLIVVWIIWWWRWTEGSHFMPMTLVLPAIVAACGLALARPRGEILSPLPAGGADAKRRVRRLPGLLRPDPLPLGEGEASSRRDAGAALALALGALVLLQREGYRGNIEAYYSGMGYVLAVPLAAMLIWKAVGGPRSAGKRTCVALSIFLFLIARFGIGRLRELSREWDHTEALTSPRGTVYVDKGSVPVIFGTYDFLKAHTSTGDPILMMPQTYAMDFLLDRRSLSYFVWVSPGYLTDERELIARLDATPPRAAVVFEGSFGIFHSGQFGEGFADSVVRWLETHLPRQEKFGADGFRGRRFLP
jgi:hypothetical protein